MAENNDVLLERVRRVVQDVFDDERLVVNEDTQLSDIPEWDSTSHLTLIMAIEDDFDVRLNAREASELVTLPQILDVLRKKMNTNSIPGRVGTDAKP